MRKLMAISAIVWASAASSQDITLNTADANDALVRILENASLTMAIDPDSAPKAQDYIAAARADYRALLTALYSEGFYGGAISITVNGREASTLSPLERIGTVRRVTLNVTPGLRFRFATTAIAPIPDGTTLPADFITGRSARSKLIRDAAAAGVTAWRDAGHAKAGVAGQSIVARHADRALDATITLDPGPRLTFGPLSITGNDAVKTAAITRIAGLPEGDVFSPAEVEKAARRLRETGAFDSVALTEPAAIGPNNTLPIAAQITESKPRRIGFGIEYSTVDGLAVSSYWMHRNAFGGAEHFRIEGEIAGIGGGTGGTDYSIATSLNIPAIYGPDTDLLATASLSREDEPDFLIDKAAIDIVATRLLFDDLEVSGGFGILTAREETDLGVREYTLLTAPLSATLDKRNTPTNASDGYYVDVELTPFVSVNGDGGGARIYADGRIYRSFGPDDRITIAARAQVGSVVGADETNSPADYLFFSGGSATVRGQGYKTLGVDSIQDGETITTGGQSFAGAQLEARYGITDSIGVVGFVDYGFVGATDVPLEAGTDHAGAGIGLRYNTGIGPIRLDLGTSVSGDNAFDNVEIYIGIGQAF